MYGEDLDLCYKIREAGFKTYFVGEASLIHYGGASSNRAEARHFNTVVKRESIAIFLKKFRGPGIASAFRLSSGLAASVRLCLVALAFPAGIILQQTAALSAVFRKWRKVLQWSLGLEKWAGRLGCRKA